MRTNKQQGFTIIELVVVILLLGILTATALPRFMDVTDEAHDSVVNGVLGGLSSGVALYRAQWYAENQPLDAVVDEFAMYANSVGYPIGINTPFDSSADCVAIFENLLQPGGRPTLASVASDGSALSSADVTSANVGTADLLAKATTTSNLCEYAYTRQFQDASLGAVPVIQVDLGAGTIVLGTDL